MDDTDASEIIRSLFDEKAVKGITLLPNHSHQRSTIPTGYVLKLDPSANLSTDIFSSSLFNQIVAVKLTNTLDLAKTAYILLPAEKRIRDTLMDKTDLQTRMNLTENLQKHDTREWAPSVGPGSFVGVYECDVPHSGKVRYLVANVNNSVPSKGAVEHLLYDHYGKDLTVGSLVSNGQFAMVRQLAERNALRVISEAADLYGLEIPREQDDAILKQPFSEMEATLESVMSVFAPKGLASVTTRNEYDCIGYSRDGSIEYHCRSSSPASITGGLFYAKTPVSALYYLPLEKSAKLPPGWPAPGGKLVGESVEDDDARLDELFNGWAKNRMKLVPLSVVLF
jgi:hypothetical protein